MNVVLILGLIIGGLVLVILLLYWNRFSNYLIPKSDNRAQMIAYQEYCQTWQELRAPMMKEGQQSDIMEPKSDIMEPNTVEKDGLDH